MRHPWLVIVGTAERGYAEADFARSWYQLVVGGNTPRYVGSVHAASILDERADQALPDKVNGLISKVTVETLNLRPNMLGDVRPEPAP